MFLVANALGNSKLNLGEAGLYAILGYAVVFLGLLLLMCVVTIVGKIFIAKAAKATKVAKAVAAPEAAPKEAPKPQAPGSAGQLKLHDVEPKTAAMLMAIVANKMGKPINELRFISIKEVK